MSGIQDVILQEVDRQGDCATAASVIREASRHFSGQAVRAEYWRMLVTQKLARSASGSVRKGIG